MGLWAALLLCLLPAAGLAESSSNEDSLKAAFILNFARYVEWPESSFKQAGEFCIASLGRSPLDRNLAALNGRSVKGRSVVFRQVSTPEAAGQCQVLFIRRAEPSRLVKMLDSLKDKQVLTVSDQDGFCSYGGMLSLVSEQGKLVFDLNLEEAQRSKLKPSSHLMRLARKIYTR